MVLITALVISSLPEAKATSIQLDNVQGAGCTTCTSIVISFNVGASATVLIVNARSNLATPPTVTGITLGSQAFTFLVKFNPVAAVNSEIWYLVNPQSGSGLLLTETFSAQASELDMIAASYVGTSQTPIEQSTSGASASPATLTVTTTHNNDLIAYFADQENNVNLITSRSGMNNHLIFISGTTNVLDEDDFVQGFAASHSGTFTGTFGRIEMFAVVLIAAFSPAGTIVGTILPLFVMFAFSMLAIKTVRSGNLKFGIAIILLAVMISLFIPIIMNGVAP